MPPLPTLPTLQGIARQGANPALRAASAYPPLSPDEEESLLESLGSASLSGLGFVAGSLDKALGGRAIRGLLDNLTGGDTPWSELASIIPFSDTLGLTNQANAASGRDILENLGAPENKPGFHPFAEPGDAAWDTASLLTEIALDPASYLSLGAAGAVKGTGGGIAKAAGLLDNAVEAAGGAVGPRMAGRSVGLGDLLGTSRNAEGALTRAAGHAAEMQGIPNFYERLGDSMLGAADPLFDAPVRDLFGVGVPLMSPSFSVHGGQIGDFLEGGLDTLGAMAKASAPVRAVRAAMDASVGGTRTAEFQPFAERFSEESLKAETGIRGESAELASYLKDEGIADPAYYPELRDVAEYGTINTPAQARFYKESRGTLDPLVAEVQKRGRKLEPHNDPAGTLYFPRTVPGGRGRGPFKVGREKSLLGIQGGTAQLMKIVQDRDILSAPTEAAAVLVAAQKYPVFVNPTQEKLLDLVGWVRKELTPDQRASGAFGLDPVRELQDTRIKYTNMIQADDTVAEALAKFALPPDKMPINTSGIMGQGVKLESLLDELGYETGPALANVDRFLPATMSGSQQRWDAFKRYVVPNNVADDIRRFTKQFSNQDVPGGLIQTFDSLTNLTKVGLLTWPARYVRDFVSGTTLNKLTGNFSMRSARDAWNIARGKNVANAHTIPLVRDILTERGMQANAANGTQVLRELLYAHDVVSPYQGIGGASNLAGATQSTLSGTEPLVSELAGSTPFSFRDVGRKAFTGKGIPGGGSANPFNVRGVSLLNKGQGVRQQTRFAPAAAGQDVGYFVEHMNRVVPWLENLRKGVDPAEAKRIADALQVNYNPSSFSKVEQEVLLRAVPFYKYPSRMLPSLLKQIAERPGGGIAQAIRAMTAGDSEGFTPDYLAGGLGIPLGEGKEPGTERFLTSFGLPMEQFNLFHYGPRGFTETGLDLLGQLNPMAKAPLELATGRQFYSDRDLRDLDSRSGRILEQAGLTDNPDVVPRWFDQLLMNSPAARAVSSVGTAVDSRKGLGAKALQLGTGLRISDVDLDKQKDIATRELIDDLLRGSGAVRSYETLYTTDPESLTPEEQLLMRLNRTIQKRGQQRKKEAIAR